MLARTQAGLETTESGFNPAEAVWVVTRLAELLAWSGPQGQVAAEAFKPG